ncbi:succinate dehydrogenase cytochrome b558 subunit [Brevibacillus dissolubilis]|uniref:succinate dehydrogenase cytochrome b558 subunit n=1 Tax=Brevibacillus dissolubilis TaxID=1844116 RepID=UPI0011161E29|nr:succinate dehydrogenase cytochrome b558 subunit [Brevibacillus dissolubilis]
MAASTKQFLYHKLHTLLGLFPIGLFVIFHLAANHQATQGPEAYNSVVEMIESTPFLIFLEFGFIYIPLLFHAVYGLYLAFLGKQNVNNYGYFRNWMFLLQRITGVITLIFVAWHVYETRIQAALGAEVGYEMMHEILSNPAMLGFYILGVLSTVFHLSNGIWSFLVHWGITVGPRSQRLATYLTVGIFVVLSVIGVRAALAFA